MKYEKSCNEYDSTFNNVSGPGPCSMIYHHPNSNIIIVNLNFYHPNFRAFQDHMSYDYNIILG